jgi:alkylation response protein AidB-like acyl-CoA dehydrogenase
MNFDFSDDQRTIKTTARELLADRSPFARVREAAESRTYDGALWQELCALGWPGIAVAEEHGGQGLGAVELAVLLEELGYAVAACSAARSRRSRSSTAAATRSAPAGCRGSRPAS